MPHWDDSGPVEEGYVRRLSIWEMLRRIGPRLHPHRRTLGLAVGLMLASVACELAAPILLRLLIDHDIPDGAKTGRLWGILATSGLYLTVFMTGTWSGFWQTIAVAKMGLALVTRLKRDTFEHLLALGMDYFDQHPPGRLLARVESDAERMQSLFSETALAILRGLILLGGTLAVMLSTNWRITLI